jgi:putative DNA methylase
LASILPPDTTREEFLKLLGIPHDKDVVAAAEKLARAKANKVKLKENPLSWERAFKHTPKQPQLDALREKISRFWGRDRVLVLDPMAGGGSIPYEALRLGLDVVAGELNPVAYIVLKATLEYPVKFRESLCRLSGISAKRCIGGRRVSWSRFFRRRLGERVCVFVG